MGRLDIEKPKPVPQKPPQPRKPASAAKPTTKPVITDYASI